MFSPSYVSLHDSEHPLGGGAGVSLGLLCLFGTIYSIYGSAWVCCPDTVIFQSSHASNHQDLLIDWSVLRMHVKYRFLRSELVYTNHIPVRVFLRDRRPSV